MTYGPIGAVMVELFPTKIRYTSISITYNIANGWMGGFMPSIAFGLVDLTGHKYAGLWYPIGICSISFVVGTLFMRETKDVDLRDDEVRSLGGYRNYGILGARKTNERMLRMESVF